MKSFLNLQIVGNKNIFCIFFLLFFMYTLTNIIISSYLFFFCHFPDSYTWTELYINYEGGLIRRGLIGQLLLCSSHIFGVRFSVALVFIPLYILFIYLSIKFFYKNTDFFTFILIITSPGLLFFFAQDRGMLCRKDIFFELGFLLQFIFISRANAKLYSLFVLLVCIFFVCLFIHESTVFYSILPFAIFLEQAYKKNKFAQYFLMLCIVAIFSLWYLISFPGTLLQHDKIINSWNDFFSLTREGALRFIGKSMSTKLTEEKLFYTATSLCYFLCGLILTAYPLFHYMQKVSAIYRIKKYFSFKLNIIIVIVGCIAPWILPFVAIDFGRHIHTGIYYLLVFIASIVSLTDGLKKEKNVFISKLMWMFLFVYAYVWKMWLYAEDAHFLSFSFPIRVFQVGWIASLDP